MYTTTGIVVGGLLAAAAAAAGLASWSWSRAQGRFVLGAVATFVAFVLWRLVLQSAAASSLDVDGPVLGLSFEDVGSGVLAFTLAALGLGLGRDRDAPAHRVTIAAAIAGLLATVVDRFV